MLHDTPFRKHNAYLSVGMLSEDPRLFALEGSLYQVEVVDNPMPIDYEFTSIECWEDGYRKVACDGWQTHPDDLRISRAAFGLFLWL